MKKALAIILAVVMVAALFIIPAAAEDYTRVESYTGGVGVGVWTGNTDGRKNTHGAAFNVAADFRYIGLPQYWNSNGSNQPLVTYVFELFNYDTDYATSVAGTPVFSQEVHPDGDAANGIQFDLGKTMPKGAYAMRFTVTSDQGYMVLPAANSAYSNVRIAYTDETFGFYIDFVEAGLSNYFAKMPNAGEELLDGVLMEKGGEAVDMKAAGAFGIRFTVPEGYALRALLGTDSPTWSNPGGGSSACVNIYKWNSDYDTTVAGDSLAYGEELDHADNATLVLNLDKDIPAGDYLAVIESIGEKPIGFWCNTTSAGEATGVYLNGAETTKYPGMKYRLLVLESEPETTGETADFQLHGASFDTIYVNDVMNFGQADGAASDKLDGVGRTIDGSDGSVQTIRIRGWIGFETEIDQLGYQINGKNTFGDYKVAPEAAVTDPANGGQYATRFDMTIDVSELKGTNKIVAVAKLADGTIVKIDENVSANGAGTTPNTSFTYIGPADENAQTGDMSVAMFAVLAVLALGAAVVFAKKRSF
jgi:hypothetical protein